MCDYNPRKCIYCPTPEIYESVSAYAKKLSRAAGFFRGGHRGKTSKSLKA